MDFHRTGYVTAASVTIAATVVLSLLARRVRTTSLTIVSTLFYYAAVTSLLLASTSQDVTILALVAIPVAWSALYQKSQVTWISLVAAGVTLAVEAFSDSYNANDIAVLLGVWLLTGVGIAVGIRALRSKLEHTIVERENELQQSAILSMATEELYASLEAEKVLQFGMQSALRLVGGDDPHMRALFFLVEGDVATLIGSYSRAMQFADETDPRVDNFAFSLKESPAIREAINKHEDRVVELKPATVVPNDIEKALASLGVERAIARAIRMGNKAGGLLAVVNADGCDDFTADQREWLRRLGAILELAIARALLHEEQTATDPLTTLFNRREFEHRLHAMPRGMRYSLLTLDVDQLKAMNDRYGHHAGDELLKTVGLALRRSVRRGDIPARVGGDEFSVIVPNADDHHCEAMAQRVINDLAEVTVYGRHPSVSIGIAGFDDGKNAEARVIAADHALYAAKHAGGNRYVFYSPGDVVSGVKKTA
jgi:diguanylate cyclase (GGDEF)-like protein